MIEPQNRKLKFFHILLALTMYVDMFMTSLLIGNYRYQIGEQEEFLNHFEVYSYIVVIQATDILLNFFKIQIIEVTQEKDPGNIAIYYLKSHFITDVISVIPYNVLGSYRNYIFLRFLKLRRFRLYQSYIEGYISEVAMDYIQTESLKKIIDAIGLILQLMLTSHFFACIWMLIGLEEYMENESGWIMSQIEGDTIELDIHSIYITSVYWVITSFSSIGYGDIVGTSDREMGY